MEVLTDPLCAETEEMLLHHVPRRAPASFCSQGWDWETPPRREWHLAWLHSPVEEAGLPAAQSSWLGTSTPAPGSESRLHSVRIQPRDVPAAAAGELSSPSGTPVPVTAPAHGAPARELFLVLTAPAPAPLAHLLLRISEGPGDFCSFCLLHLQVFPSPAC